MKVIKSDKSVNLEEFIRQETDKKSVGNTAISRKAPSRPMRFLYDKGLLIGRMLDYGCGRGTDAKFFGMEAYDPYWMPTKPTGAFDTITCHFVLNVVNVQERKRILSEIQDLLSRTGKAYITVRRDMKKGYGVRGYSQNLVYLNLPSIEKNNGYEIYELSK